MRQSLEDITLAEIANQVGTGVPKSFSEQRDAWFADRQASRRESKIV